MIHTDISLSNAIFCVGGGPSLKGFDWSRLNDKRVIAINKAFSVLPNADYVYFSDLRFWGWYREELINHRAVKVTGSKDVRHPSVENYKFTGLRGLDDRHRCLRTGNNSGYAAINLAVHLRAKFILLLGYDMSYEDGTHWHDGYPTRLGRLPKMLPWFDSAVKDLDRLNVKVYNCNLNSAIECFPKVDINYVLRLL